MRLAATHMSSNGIRFSGKVVSRLCAALILGSTLASSQAMAQGLGVCTDSTNQRGWFYKHKYAAYVSSTIPKIVADRNAAGLPALSYSQVQLVTDSATCRSASSAFDAQLTTKRPTVPVIVLALGTRRVVIKDTGSHGPWMNMIFNQDFSVLLDIIGM